MKILEHGWLEDKIGNLPLSLIDSDRSKRYPKRAEFKTDGVVFLNAESISGGYFDISKVNYISFEKYEEITKGRLQQNDLILTMRGNGVGNTALFTSKIPFGLINAQMLILRPKEGEIHSNFLYYLFINPQFQKLLANFVTGSAQPQLTMTHLRHVPITLPTLLDQEAIAHILGSLDERIDLNRRMNETLEGMAQALFKSWFVDFDPVLDNALASGKEIPPELREKAEARRKLRDSEAPFHPLPKEILTLFPDEFTFTDELGWIPKGWEVKTFLELITLIGGGTPKTSVKEYWNGDIPWFSVVDAPKPSDVFVIDTEKHVTPLGVDKSSTKILSVGTTIISARGTVGKCSIVGQPMAMNQSCYGIRGNGGISDMFIYFTTKEHVDRLQKGGHGSVFNTITRDTFKTIKMAFGNENITQQFEKYIKSFLDKILHNNFENVNLAKLRDTLLPKLLSGEIRIPDAEKLVEGIKV